MTDLEKTLEEYNDFLRSLKDLVIALKDTRQSQNEMIEKVSITEDNTRFLIEQLNIRHANIRKLKVNHLEE